MSAEREKFEAWFSNKYPETLKAAILEETDPKYVNESHGNVATRERLWECWQARAEARPSVSEPNFLMTQDDKMPCGCPAAT